ncbi:MAG: helix-turn-helix domain-containing protein [Alphaproteobacteria bacterium]
MPRISKSRRVASELLAAMDEVLAYAEGQLNLPTRHVEVSEVTVARRALDLTQEEFSTLLDIPLSTVRKWERGGARPSGAAATLLKIIRRNPKAVREALAG